MNREEWLNQALENMKPIFTEAGIDWPDLQRVRISVGFPVRKALSKKKRAIGQCFVMEASANKYNEIFISPVIDNGVQVLCVAAHEIIHALDNCESGHKGFFAMTHKAIGLVGKTTASEPGPELTVRLNDVLKKIGDYPHKQLEPKTKEKTQTTRLLKALCPGCGYVIRVTRQWVEDAGLPTCPCGAVFQVVVKGEQGEVLP